MGTKRRIAAWRKVGKLFVVSPPGWPKNTRLSFTDQETMIAWARGEGLILRDETRRPA